jgi:hypothetical protein
MSRIVLVKHKPHGRAVTVLTVLFKYPLGAALFKLLIDRRQLPNREAKAAHGTPVLQYTTTNDKLSSNMDSI